MTTFFPIYRSSILWTQNKYTRVSQEYTLFSEQKSNQFDIDCAVSKTEKI